MRIFDETGVTVDTYRSSQRPHLCCDEHTSPEQLSAGILRLIPVQQALPMGLAVDGRLRIYRWRGDRRNRDAAHRWPWPQPATSRTRGRCCQTPRRDVWPVLGFMRIFCPVPPSTLFSDRSIDILLAAMEYPITEEQVKLVLAREKISTHGAIKCSNTARAAATTTTCIQPRRLGSARPDLFSFLPRAL